VTHRGRTITNDRASASARSKRRRLSTFGVWASDRTRQAGITERRPCPASPGPAMRTRRVDRPERDGAARGVHDFARLPPGQRLFVVGRADPGDPPVGVQTPIRRRSDRPSARAPTGSASWSWLALPAATRGHGSAEVGRGGLKPGCAYAAFKSPGRLDDGLAPRCWGRCTALSDAWNDFEASGPGRLGGRGAENPESSWYRDGPPPHVTRRAVPISPGQLHASWAGKGRPERRSTADRGQP
jgi:hypothetical protein